MLNLAVFLLFVRSFRPRRLGSQPCFHQVYTVPECSLADFAHSTLLFLSLNIIYLSEVWPLCLKYKMSESWNHFLSSPRSLTGVLNNTLPKNKGGGFHDDLQCFGIP